MERNFNLSAPWYTYGKKIDALFGKDPDIKVSIEDDGTRIKLYVTGIGKAYALTRLLPTTKEFGEVTVRIDVIPANTDSKIDLIEEAFAGNPVLSFIDRNQLQTNPLNYVVFRNEVVQFYNDQLDDVHGNLNTLYQELAKEILGKGEGVYYCTDYPVEELDCVSPF